MMRLLRKIGLIGLMGLIGLIGPIGLMGCSKVTPEEQAAMAAKGYYTHLMAGQYESFLEGKFGSDTLPSDYREQLLTGYRQFMAQQQEQHRGIIDVQVSNVVTDTLDRYTNVFLLLCYGDSTQEEIVVPMIAFADGRWRMK